MQDWSLTDQASEADLAVLSDGVTTHGRALATGGHARPIACFVREAGLIVAGGSGRTEFKRLFVNYLWVAEPLRSQGLGRQLLARLEAAALERGCEDALIETLNDRTAALYQRQGYAPLATIPRYVGGFTRHVLLKPLIPA